MKVYETYGPNITSTPPVSMPNKNKQLFHLLIQAKNHVELKNYEQAQKIVNGVLMAINIEKSSNTMVIDFFRVIDFINEQLKSGEFDPQRIIGILEQLTDPLNPTKK